MSLFKFFLAVNFEDFVGLRRLRLSWDGSHSAANSIPSNTSLFNSLFAQPPELEELTTRCWRPWLSVSATLSLGDRLRLLELRDETPRPLRGPLTSVELGAIREACTCLVELRFDINYNAPDVSALLHPIPPFIVSSILQSLPPLNRIAYFTHQRKDSRPSFSSPTVSPPPAP
jgi:hypothetical protein